MNTSIPTAINESISSYFNRTAKKIEIKGFSFSSGGCINSAGVLSTSLGKFFLKWNNHEKFPGMFKAEAKGLELLRSPDVIHVPKPLYTSEANGWSFLLTDYVAASAPCKSYWKDLGQSLAALHRITSGNFGLDHDNYIGSLLQPNPRETDWINFLITHRLDYQLRLAIDHGKMGDTDSRKFQILYKELGSILPNEEVPSLIHGDLWSGNVMTGPRGEPVIFDPAVYFGHREIELAMTRLFGGFSPEFYEVYQSEFPCEPGLQERIEIYQLYPLMVHVNLFGGGYISQVRSTLNRYC